LAHIASGTIKGRTTAGTGDVQDITVSQALDLIGSTRGQILFRGLSSWSSLVPGSANQILRSNGPSSDPDYISLSTLLPVGSVIQTVVAQTQVASSNTVVLPADSTVPQIGEGTLILSASITPSSATNKILVQVEVAGASSVIAVIALFRDASANAIAATQISSAAAGIGSMVINFQDTLSGISTVTYTVRVGPGSAGTFFVNQSSAGNTLGGVHVSSIILKEIKG
jgi:hypothetical protein